MKKIIILPGLIILISFFLCIKGQNGSESEGGNSITGYIDHVIATLPSRQFELLDSFLTVHYKSCWMNQPGVGYLVSNSQRPYVELWDAGVFFQGGYQVAFAREKKEDDLNQSLVATLPKNSFSSKEKLHPLTENYVKSHTLN